jgi:hypothetical protein
MLVLLVGALCAGCGASGGPAASPEGTVRPSAFAEAHRLSTGLPAMPPAEIAPALKAQAMKVDLAGGRCPPAGRSSADFTLGSGPTLSAGAAAMLVCRYKQPGLTARGPATVTDPAVVESWRQRFNALPAVDPRGRRCPRDDRGALVVGFLPKSYPGEVVYVSLGGCRFVTTGTVTRSTDAAFLADLTRLVP